jgi:hypothetical protein
MPRDACPGSISPCVPVLVGALPVTAALAVGAKAISEQ